MAERITRELQPYLGTRFREKHTTEGLKRRLILDSRDKTVLEKVEYAFKGLNSFPTAMKVQKIKKLKYLCEILRVILKTLEIFFLFQSFFELDILIKVYELIPIKGVKKMFRVAEKVL